MKHPHVTYRSKSSTNRFAIPFCQGNAVTNVITPDVAQEFLEKLEDKDCVDHCEKVVDEALERLQKPFFVKIKG
ncbi:MAG: protein phosphatase 2C family protein [Burkholderiales bacterium]|nr:protein phosphatase 2C family protein [Burkholderiales bacterium]